MIFIMTLDVNVSVSEKSCKWIAFPLTPGQKPKHQTFPGTTFLEFP